MTTPGTATQWLATFHLPPRSLRLHVQTCVHCRNRPAQVQNTAATKTVARNMIVNRATPIGLKSPSDTTIYSPGVRKASSGGCDTESALIGKISNFVEGIRLDSNRNAATRELQSQ